MPPPDSSKIFDSGTGVIVLGHGSRAHEALTLLNWVAEQLSLRLEPPVRAASLQFNQPTLADCCRELVAGGARRVVVVPYFLFDGNHMQKDIPEELDRLRSELPGTEFILADSLGADDLLVEVLARRTLAKLGSQRMGDAGRNSCGPLPQHPIEAESFEIIDSLLEPDDPEDPEYQVMRRIVHSTGDPSLARAVVFSRGAVAAGVNAVAAGASIYCDVNMVAAGVGPTAARLGLEVSCLVADPEVARLSRREGITRGAAALRLAAGGSAAGGAPGDGSGLDGAIVAVGNAPTALFELLRLVREEGARPALVIGVPVGFVGAAESKAALAASGLPHITLPGNRGGSTMAVAIINALIRLSVARSQKIAESIKETAKRPEGPSL